MSELPDRIRSYLVSVATLERDAAWIVAEPGGRVREAGGALAEYGLDALEVGGDLEAAAHFLAGLLPMSEPLLHLPHIEVEPGRFADLHLVRDGEDTIVLLLDATSDVSERAPLQQRGNDMTLWLEELGSGRAAASAEVHVPRALDAAVFEGEGEGEGFRLVGDPPRWLQRFRGDPAGEGDGLDILARMPFLENFLFDARRFWAEHEDDGARAATGRLRSGVWTEVGPNGKEWNLEAIAVAIPGGRRLLVVQRLQESFEERRRLLQRARDANLAFDRARRDGQKKDVLLHCIVHDLKGPLSSMMGSLSLLCREGLAEERRRELAELGIAQARKQSEMIGEILEVFAAELSALDAFHPDPENAPDAAAVLGELVRAMRPGFRVSGVELELEVEGDGPWRVVGEADRLERVFANLLENALRHAPEGTAVRAELRVEGDSVVAEVSDAGPGVPEAMRDRLFDRLSKGESPGTSGLGLYYCQLTVRRWGGEIGYEPARGGGARFWFRLPRSPRAAE